MEAAARNLLGAKHRIPEGRRDCDLPMDLRSQRSQRRKGWALRRQLGEEPTARVTCQAPGMTGEPEEEIELELVQAPAREADQ